MRHRRGNCAPPGFGIKAKLAAAAASSERFCPPRIWNQGKATSRGHLSVAHCAPPDLESRQSASHHACRRRMIVPPPDLESRQSWHRGTATDRSQLCPPRIWNQGKAQTPPRAHDQWHSAPPGFGIKAKRGMPVSTGRRYCAPPDLESRQSESQRSCADAIVPPPDLESRQSARASIGNVGSLLCPPRIWNQGKADGVLESPAVIVPPPDLESRQSDVSEPGHARHIVPPPDLESRQSSVTDWQSVHVHSAPPGFGIKAKPRLVTRRGFALIPKPGGAK